MDKATRNLLNGAGQILRTEYPAFICEGEEDVGHGCDINVVGSFGRDSLVNGSDSLKSVVLRRSRGGAVHAASMLERQG